MRIEEHLKDIKKLRNDVGSFFHRNNNNQLLLKIFYVFFLSATQTTVCSFYT